MSLRAVHRGKALVVFRGLGRLLPRMREVVAEKGPLLPEVHFTLRALEWALPWVGSQMSQQTLLQAEALPTLVTWEVPVCRRGTPLRLHVSLPAEFLPGSRQVLRVAPLMIY